MQIQDQASAPTQTLDVFLHGEHIGILNCTRKGGRFTYDESLMETFAGKPLLSSALPVKSRPYNEGLTNNWFRGLLPEGKRLDIVNKYFGCKSGDYIELLAHIGWECAGAVSAVPAGLLPPEEEETAPMTEAELIERLTHLSEAYGPNGTIPRLSLGGYQDKLCLVSQDIDIQRGYVTACTFAAPTRSAISTHILKPQPRTMFPGLIESEAWGMEAARHAVRCANTALMTLDGAPVTLVIERFDRKKSDDGLVRLHQEDCCQALGLDPEGKYADYRLEKGTDPTYVGIAGIIERFADDSVTEKCELLKQMTVNLAIGNMDAHAKNYAFLYPAPCELTLSPMYDVAPTINIDVGNRFLSMRINGKLDSENINAADLVAEAMSWGLTRSMACDTVAATLDKLTQGIDSANEMYPEAAARHSDSTMRCIARLR